MSKTFLVSVNASPKYPMVKSYTIKATTFAAAIGQAIRYYWRDRPFKGSRVSKCWVSAQKIKE